MNLCIFGRINNPDRFVDVYNWGNYVIRYRGEYTVGGFPSRFCTEPIIPLDHKKITFPDDATSVQFSVEKWFFDEGIWDAFAGIVIELPGGYCYRSAGTFERSRFDEILCP